MGQDGVVREGKDGIVTSPSLEVFKAILDRAWSSLV